MAENKTDSLANGCPVTVESVNVSAEEISNSDVETTKNTADLNPPVKVKLEESPDKAKSQIIPTVDTETKTKDVNDSNPEVKEEEDLAHVPIIDKSTATSSTGATTSGSVRESEIEIVKEPESVNESKDIEDGNKSTSSVSIDSNEVPKSTDKEIVAVSVEKVEKTCVDDSKTSLKDVVVKDKVIAVSESKQMVEDVVEVKTEDEHPAVTETAETDLKDKLNKVVQEKESADVNSPPNLTPEVNKVSNHCKNDDNDDQVEEEEDEDDEEEMENEEPEGIGEEEEEDDDDDEDDEENENEQLELGIVGPPTAVSELINEEELRCGESVLLTEDRRGVENVQDHVAEWVQNSANNKVEELTIDEDENENIDSAEIIRSDQTAGMQKSIENNEKNAEVLTTRKSKRVVSNIIKRSIKCLNKMHAMDVSGVIKGTGEKVPTSNSKKVDEILERQENTLPKKVTTGERREIETTTAAVVVPRSNHRDRRNHQNHSNHRRNGGEPPEDRVMEEQAYHGVKKEPNSEPETDPEPERDLVPELRKRTGITERQKNIKTERERESKKRRSTDETQNSNGSSKRACLEQREEFISSLVGGEKVTTEELNVRAEQLRAELQALDQLARAKEKEWNEILSMRKLKEEAYLRIERRRQVVGFMEGSSQLNETSVLPSASLSMEPEWDNAKEKSSSTEATLSDKSTTRPQVTSKQNENGQKESSDGQNSETRQIGEGRQGPMVDVRTIIADYRLRHPETVPRRSRRMRNSVNVGLGAGGAMVETTHIGADSRPSSTDSCKSSSNATDPSNSMSFKDVLVQFAKLSQQQGEAVKTPQNYPDVTLHPVLPSPATPQTTAIQQTGSLLHGILTKSQSPRPTTFSPTLARLLTAPERDRCNPIATSTPQQAATTQHLLQAYQGTNPVSISDLLSSSKARTEITITPVVSAPAPQSHSNSLIHVEDVEEETTVIEDRGRSSNPRDDSPPRCQGCQDRAAQFVCAGCGNQWYCSRECQVSAWDEHSEVCSG